MTKEPFLGVDPSSQAEEPVSDIATARDLFDEAAPDNVVFKANRATAAPPMPVVTEYGEGELPTPTITARSGSIISS